MSDLGTLAKQGMEAISKGEVAEAIEAFQGALELAPERPDMNHALGMAYLHRGDAGSAIDHLKAAVKLSEPYDQPEHMAMRRDFHMSLATAYQLMDQVADAQQTLELVRDKWPDFLEAGLQLGQLYLSTGQLEQGLSLYKDATDDLDKEQREAAEALIGCTEGFLESEHKASVFLQGHAESYKAYFDEIAGTQVQAGWYAEAAHMGRGSDGEPAPILAEGARPYAFSRVDLVNPADGKVSGVYSEQEPMVVALNGLEPLAQVPILFPWDEYEYPVLVSSRCPWHWLSIVVQFESSGTVDERIGWLDEVIGDWYLSGYNGSYGEQDSGRFHYITDPEAMGDQALSYVVDLGRARFEAISALLTRLAILHDKQPIRRVIFGEGRLAD